MRKLLEDLICCVFFSGGARGGQRGLQHPSRRHLAPLSEEILGSCWRKFGKMMYENTAFSAISAPLSEALAPQSGATPGIVDWFSFRISSLLG